MNTKFDASSVTDAKRLARGEQLLYARSRLQGRDGVHHRNWRVLMLAGGVPSGEINAIRELMPKAHITAVDKDPQCLEAACDAGADDVILCDLNTSPSSILDAGRFDLVNMDLCTNASEGARWIARTYHKTLTTHGIFMFTFSYGRDVVPLFVDAWDFLSTQADNVQAYNHLRLLVENGGAPLHVCQRIAYLFSPAMIKSLRSVVLYRGAEMPMCSLLFQKRLREPAPLRCSFVRIGDGDFEVAVTHPDISKLYDCPQERLESLRRSYTAFKAWQTTKHRKGMAAVSVRATQGEA